MLSSPMRAIFLRAAFLAQRSGHYEVSVDSFLAALDAPEIDAIIANPDAHAEEFALLDTKTGTGWSFIPMSDELKQALATAGWSTPGEDITTDKLREALISTRKSGS